MRYTMSFGLQEIYANHSQIKNCSTTNSQEPLGACEPFQGLTGEMLLVYATWLLWWAGKQKLSHFRKVNCFLLLSKGVTHKLLGSFFPLRMKLLNFIKFRVKIASQY